MSRHANRMTEQLFKAAQQTADKIAALDPEAGKLAQRKLDALPEKPDLGQVHKASSDIFLIANKVLRPEEADREPG